MEPIEDLPSMIDADDGSLDMDATWMHDNDLILPETAQNDSIPTIDTIFSIPSSSVSNCSSAAGEEQPKKQIKVNQILQTISEQQIIKTIYLKTPKKLKKVPLQFSAFIPSIGNMNIVYNPKKFDTNQFIPFEPRKIAQINFFIESDTEFYSACSNSAALIYPKEMHFIPEEFWPDGPFEFGDIVSSFFQKKNNQNSRFYHKLYNALQISKNMPEYVHLVGVEWLTDDVIKVNSKEFARLLGIKSVDGSLFHKQGNFPTHGFVELTRMDVMKSIPSDLAQQINFADIKAIRHKTGGFTKKSTESDLDQCNWVKRGKDKQDNP